MIRNRWAPLVVALFIFAAGLAFGAGKSSDDTSTANSVSKVLLLVGTVAIVAALALMLVRRQRARQRAS
jgi:hypothetical protein